MESTLVEMQHCWTSRVTCHGSKGLHGNLVKRLSYSVHLGKQTGGGHLSERLSNEPIFKLGQAIIKNAYEIKFGKNQPTNDVVIIVFHKCKQT